MSKPHIRLHCMTFFTDKLWWRAQIGPHPIMAPWRSSASAALRDLRDGYAILEAIDRLVDPRDFVSAKPYIPGR